MNSLDFAVLIISLLSISIYGIWQTRNRRDLRTYVRGTDHTPWLAIGLSVMATQASAITFLSTPGQGYTDGLSFVQIYFGVPLALITISIIFLPIYSRLNVYTAYEYLERRFDGKTRMLGAGLFLLQRGLGAGLTIYAPAIVVTTVFGWPLQLTVICCGLLVIAYTVIGGSDAVTITQKYQMAIIFAGMVTAVCTLIGKLPAHLSLVETLRLAGEYKKLNAVSFSPNLHDRYTLWSGLLGGTFLMLSYFGTDQSQVQRYISGSSLRESRLGLLFNAIFKIPMQFSILSIGVLIFVFYQFNPAPLFFDATSAQVLTQSTDSQLHDYEHQFDIAHKHQSDALELWLAAKRAGNEERAKSALVVASVYAKQGESIRADAGKSLATKSREKTANDADFVFITFIMRELPHGAIGLIIAAFFAAALSSKAAELNALGTSTCIDFYRRFKQDASDEKCLLVTKWATAVWGIFATVFALYAHLSENLIQAVNIIGSIFYGVLLALFLVAFFVRNVGGTAIFWAAIVAQSFVFFLYFNLAISYLWFP